MSEWIPTKREKPQDDTKVLACTRMGELRVMRRLPEDDEGRVFFWLDGHHDMDDSEIVAWMPLPKPYKED